MIFSLMLILFSVMLPSAALSQTQFELWPTGAPGIPSGKLATDDDKPNITVYPAINSNGAGMVILPGGGYGMLASDHEGVQPAKWLNGLGVTAFVVKYRLASHGYHHPIQMWDGQRAVRWVRANAKKYSIDPKRVGILGFSAGGHLASTVSTHYDSGNANAADTVDRFSCRPDWSLLAYPVITMDASFTHMGSRVGLLGNSPTQALVDSLSNEKQVTSKTPPAFLFHAKDDEVVKVKNSQVYFDSLGKRGVPAELKLYEVGGHGFGLANSGGSEAWRVDLATWPTLAAQWMSKMGYFNPASTDVKPMESFPRAGSSKTKTFGFQFRHFSLGLSKDYNAAGRQSITQPGHHP